MWHQLVTPVRCQRLTVGNVDQMSSVRLIRLKRRDDEENKMLVPEKRSASAQSLPHAMASVQYHATQARLPTSSFQSF
jgi:hypothetical protein